MTGIIDKKWNRSACTVEMCLTEPQKDFAVRTVNLSTF